jgi:hypothetical protein
MPAKPKPVVVLAETLLAALRAERDRGPTRYPLTLQRLVALADPQPPADLCVKALKHKAFTAHVVLAQKNRADSPIVLVEDVDRLAEWPPLVEWLLEQLCTPQAPAIALDKLGKKVEPPLRAAFAAALTRLVQNGDLAASVGVVAIKKKPHLFLKRMPPPAPPKAPDVELAEKLLHALESRRDEANGFPWTLSVLLANVASGVDSKLVKKALGSKLLKPRLITVAKSGDSPVALIEDTDRLLTSAALVEFALNATRTQDNQAVALKDLPKKVSKALQGPFKQALGNQLARRILPASVGVLAIKKQLHFFFWRDVDGRPLTAPQPAVENPPLQPPSSPPSDFAAVFEQAFDRLDRQHGSLNLVSLVDLRQVLNVDRETFDRELRELRRAGRFSLSAAEGRHGLSPEEQAAAIIEGETVLLFAARKT